MVFGSDGPGDTFVISEGEVQPTPTPTPITYAKSNTRHQPLHLVVYYSKMDLKAATSTVGPAQAAQEHIPKSSKQAIHITAATTPKSH